MPTSAPVHRPIGAQTRAERRRAYDLARGSRGAVYNYRWQKLRRAFLDLNPLCACGCGYAAEVVDHKTPHRGDASLMYSWDNLQAMTKACHDRKTATEDGGFGHPIRRT